MRLFNLTEENLLRKALKKMTEDRDCWKQACIDLIVHQQYGEQKVSYKRYKEIFNLCYDATHISDDGKEAS